MQCSFFLFSWINIVFSCRQSSCDIFCLFRWKYFSNSFVIYMPLPLNYDLNISPQLQSFQERRSIRKEKSYFMIYLRDSLFYKPTLFSNLKKLSHQRKVIKLLHNSLAKDGYFHFYFLKEKFNIWYLLKIMRQSIDTRTEVIQKNKSQS